MNDTERDTLRAIGTAAAVTGVAVGTYALAISHLGQLASMAIVWLVVALALFVAAAEPDDSDAATAEDLK